MRERSESIPAYLAAARAQQMPDFDVVTFDGDGVRPNRVPAYAELSMNGNRIAAGLIAGGLAKADRSALDGAEPPAAYRDDGRAIVSRPSIAVKPVLGVLKPWVCSDQSSLCGEEHGEGGFGTGG